MTPPKFLTLLALLLTLPTTAEDHRLLYVAVPGIRTDFQRGGSGILVFDIDNNHQFLRRIPVPALGDATKPQAAKGICASALTHRLYVSTPVSLSCLDLITDQLVWQKSYDAGCDRMSISPDGKLLYEPTMEGPYWHVIDASTGDELAKVVTNSGAHNTVYAPDGKHVYLAGLKSPLLTIADPSNHSIAGTVGPFTAPVRPFTINSKSTLVYACVNSLLGFEIGDLTTGKKLHRVEVTGFPTGPTLRHGCPAHGIALTPDESELWLCDGHNSQLVIFDNTQMPPRQTTNIPLRDQPGWITFSINGQFAYPSTGEVIDPHTHKILLALKDETGAPVHSEKLLEIDFTNKTPTQTGDQFGIGRAPTK